MSTLNKRTILIFLLLKNITVDILFVSTIKILLDFLIETIKLFFEKSTKSVLWGDIEHILFINV